MCWFDDEIDRPTIEAEASTYRYQCLDAYVLVDDAFSTAVSKTECPNDIPNCSAISGSLCSMRARREPMNGEFVNSTVVQTSRSVTPGPKIDEMFAGSDTESQSLAAQLR